MLSNEVLFHATNPENLANQNSHKILWSLTLTFVPSELYFFFLKETLTASGKMTLVKSITQTVSRCHDEIRTEPYNKAKWPHTVIACEDEASITKNKEQWKNKIVLFSHPNFSTASFKAPSNKLVIRNILIIQFKMKATMITRFTRPHLDNVGSTKMGCIYSLILNRALFALP